MGKRGSGGGSGGSENRKERQIERTRERLQVKGEENETGGWGEIEIE